MDKKSKFSIFLYGRRWRPEFLSKKQRPVEHQYPFFFCIFAVAKKGWPAALGTDEGVRPPTGIWSAPSMMGATL